MGTHVPHGKIILPLYLAGNAGWFATLLRAGENAVIDLNERFEKQSPRSRFYLAGPNGKLCLSFPLLHGEVRTQGLSQQLLFEEKLNKKIAWKTIKSCLGSSPFFIHFADELSAIFEKEHKHLSHFSIDILHFCCNAINMRTSINFADSDFMVSQQDVDLRKHDFESFDNEKYIQVFSDRFEFMPHLSILDLIFNLGPDAQSYLRRMN